MRGVDSAMIMVCLREAPCSTTDELAERLGHEPLRVRLRLETMQREGRVEAVPGSVPRQWRLPGSEATRAGDRPPLYRRVGPWVETPGGRMVDVSVWCEEHGVPLPDVPYGLDTGYGAKEALMTPKRRPRESMHVEEEYR